MNAMQKLVLATGITAAVALGGFGAYRALTAPPTIRYAKDSLEISQSVPQYIVHRRFVFDGKDCSLTLSNLIFGEDTARDYSCDGIVDRVDFTARLPFGSDGVDMRISRQEKPTAFAHADAVYRRALGELEQRVDIARQKQNWMVSTGKLPQAFLRL